MIKTVPKHDISIRKSSQRGGTRSLGELNTLLQVNEIETQVHLDPSSGHVDQEALAESSVREVQGTVENDFRGLVDLNGVLALLFRDVENEVGSGLVACLGGHHDLFVVIIG